jgi:hypothetical protein
VENLLGDTIDRAIEARGNGEAAIIRAQQMALTIGQNLKLFKDLGSYEKGDLDHTFAERPIIPVGVRETAETVKIFTDAGAGLAQAAKAAGMSEDEANKLAASRQLRPQDSLIPPVLNVLNGSGAAVPVIPGITNGNAS